MPIPEQISKQKVSIGLAILIALVIVEWILIIDWQSDHEKEDARQYQEFKDHVQRYNEDH